MKRWLSVCLLWATATCGQTGAVEEGLETRSAGGTSDTATVASSPIEFASVYTDLATDCRPALQPEAEDEGSDVPEVCEGRGGYEVWISFAATAVGINIHRAGFHVDLVGDPNVMRRKLEWRLAGGQPFAVILRVVEWNPDALPEDSAGFLVDRNTGEYLIVKGLEGYPQIDFKVDVTGVADANQTARSLADGSYAPRS